MTRLGLALALLPCLAAPCLAQESNDLSTGLDQCLGCAVPTRRQRRAGGDPTEGPGRHKSTAELLERAESRHGQAAGRVLERDH